RRMEEAQRILTASRFASDTHQLSTTLDLAEAYRMAGRNGQAVREFERAAKLLSWLGRDETQTAVVLFNDWALALDRLGRPLDAQKLFLRAIAISRTSQAEDAVSPMVLNHYAK